jgi:hypothetical protein
MMSRCNPYSAPAPVLPSVVNGSKRDTRGRDGTDGQGTGHVDFLNVSPARCYPPQHARIVQRPHAGKGEGEPAALFVTENGRFLPLPVTAWSLKPEFEVAEARLPR